MFIFGAEVQFRPDASVTSPYLRRHRYHMRIEDHGDEVEEGDASDEPIV